MLIFLTKNIFLFVVLTCEVISSFHTLSLSTHVPLPHTTYHPYCTVSVYGKKNSKIQKYKTDIAMNKKHDLGQWILWSTTYWHRSHLKAFPNQGAQRSILIYWLWKIYPRQQADYHNEQCHTFINTVYSSCLCLFSRNVTMYIWWYL